ncbi:MAG: hypothetical protein J5741_08640 [Bacteroidales bacterium]|nr:hypothetical protein [Bacteroidales bacterium]
MKESSFRDWFRGHYHFGKPLPSARQALREGLLPIVGILLITGVLVALFALSLHFGSDMKPIIDPHYDDGELVDPNPMRFVFMLTAFVAAFVFAAFADRSGMMKAFWLGYTGGTLLWQSTGECAWHFSIPTEEYIMCFPHIEGASAVIMVIVCTVLLVYCLRRRAFSWGVWIFVLSFIGNWFGHFIQIGSYPLVHRIMEETSWFVITGWTFGLASITVALVLNFFAARTTKARLCCALLAYFGLGILVTGVAGL